MPLKMTYATQQKPVEFSILFLAFHTTLVRKCQNKKKNLSDYVVKLNKDN